MSLFRTFSHLIYRDSAAQCEGPSVDYHSQWRINPTSALDTLGKPMLMQSSGCKDRTG